MQKVCGASNNLDIFRWLAFHPELQTLCDESAKCIKGVMVMTEWGFPVPMKREAEQNVSSFIFHVDCMNGAFDQALFLFALLILQGVTEI